MRRSTLIALGYVGAGGLFLLNAVTGAALHNNSRNVTWGVLGVLWLVLGGYAAFKPGQFDNEMESETVIDYDLVFLVVLVLLLILGIGVVLNLLGFGGSLGGNTIGPN